MSGQSHAVTTPALWGRAGLTGLVVGIMVAAIVGAGSAVVRADPAQAADNGQTSSAVTLTNKANAIEPEGAPFENLAVTVSQTKDLVSQGIRVSWTGGIKSDRPGSTGGANFLQIAQCWGEDPQNPGHPDRRTCQYGGTLGFGSKRDGSTRAADVAEKDLPFTAMRTSTPPPTYTAIPFVAYNPAGIVDETLAPAESVLTNLTHDANGALVQKSDEDFVDLNTNPFFTAFTSNEVAWAPSGADGSGSVPFEVQTAMQSTGLGCGTPVTQADGAIVGSSCWLVIIPRGTGDSGSPSITRSGIWWDSWEHHLAVKLDFKPLGVRCQLGAAERQLAGSELIAGAIASWQPRLCTGPVGAPFVLNQSNEADALERAAGTAPSPLAFTSQALDTSRIGGAADPLVYAPVAVSGLAVSFAIDRQPNPQTATPEYLAGAGLPMTEMNLTPRLVAKLLTASYVEALPDGGDKSHIGYKSFTDPGKNPRTLLQDPDFLAVNNAEWAAQIIVGASIADVLLPSGRSDLAIRLWEYVLADAEAKAWLDGAADPWGMVVNPWFSTKADVNLTHSALVLPSESFPKADPIEKPDATVTDPGNGTGPVNLVTWRPFTHSFSEGAYFTLRGDGRTLGAWDRIATPPKFGRSVRELFGSQKVAALTTAPAAELYKTVTASLRNPAGNFVQPQSDGLLAAVAAMTPTAGQANVMTFDQSGAAAKAAATAYPLTMPVYAAVNPAQTDVQLRATYANLIRYAAGSGQTPGTDVGQLPPGYAPLPAQWAARSMAAADAIEQGIVPAPPSSGGAGNTPSNPMAQRPAVPAAGTNAAAPDAAGDAAGALSGGATPKDPELGVSAFAIPAGVLSGLAAALGVPLIPRIRRRL